MHENPYIVERKIKQQVRGNPTVQLSWDSEGRAGDARFQEGSPLNEKQSTAATDCKDCSSMESPGI